MRNLLVVVDDARKADTIKNRVGPIIQTTFVDVDELADRCPSGNVLFDVDLCDDGVFSVAREWVARRIQRRHTIVMIDRNSLIDPIRAAALYASDTCYRPVERDEILNCLYGDFDVLALGFGGPVFEQVRSVGCAVDALEDIFAASRFGGALDQQKIADAVEGLSEQILDDGIDRWINVVRNHHSQTYQHSLIVVGMMASFCQRLGFGSVDHKRLAMGAMLHDIGKVHIPVSILEKPGALDESEWAVMKRHPEFGFNTLLAEPHFDKTILDMVLHHHEFLDGSGYPHRLPSSEISDCTRIMTICDVFGALIEKRSYKDALPAEAAFDILLKMGSKIDQQLVREFRFASQIQLAA